MKRLAIALALLLAVSAGWYFGSPWWTLWRMQQAAEARDAEALSAHVDYPTLRESAKEQMATRFGPRTQAPLGRLADLLAARLAGAAVDALVGPKALQLVFSAQPISWKTPEALRLRAREMTMQRDSLGQFRLVQKNGGRGGALIFRWQGWGWKLSAIQLPAGDVR